MKWREEQKAAQYWAENDLSELAESSELLGQASMPCGPHPLTSSTPCYSPLPELWDRPVVTGNDLQDMDALRAAVKEAEEATAAAANVLSQRTRAGCNTQPTKKVVAAAAAVARPKFGSTSLAGAARGGKGGVGAKAVEVEVEVEEGIGGSGSGRRRRRNLSDVSVRSLRKEST